MERRPRTRWDIVYVEYEDELEVWSGDVRDISYPVLVNKIKFMDVETRGVSGNAEMMDLEDLPHVIEARREYIWNISVGLF